MGTSPHEDMGISGCVQWGNYPLMMAIAMSGT